ncbi:hypothetical protein [Spiroplasma citri]|uniref:Uncharacterized protein n=1 Tax=Spiroplasma citri TaxID=2133 RepID=A0AAJ4EIA9_SPICI|nr:hypothetical protein [Spiroplasma citri]APE74056.1 hypothetical protein SCITRI_00142 [Spiroplasma citri]QED24055.1 hypothetical protein FRX96_00615 [Spiroplasma citri]QIA66333.1 hypothetical protein GMI18_00675 [Spiroplasma citri]QIA68208.1 hypothetical protein GL298_00790 [Spiroplasma citri]QIA70084.1 hypothetical protein GL981_00795 [Spiroplasma citri]
MNKLFKNGDPDEVIKYLKKLITRKNIKEYPFLKDKKDKINGFIKYIKNNSEGIKVYKENWYMGSYTEPQISHNVKWLKKYGAKSYSEKVFKNMIALKMTKENGVNLIEFYLNKLNKKNEKEYNYYFKNEDKYNQQFLINKNVAHQAQCFV